MRESFLDQVLKFVRALDTVGDEERMEKEEIMSIINKLLQGGEESGE